MSHGPCGRGGAACAMLATASAATNIPARIAGVIARFNVVLILNRMASPAHTHSLLCIAPSSLRGAFAATDPPGRLGPRHANPPPRGSAVSQKSASKQFIVSEVRHVFAANGGEGSAVAPCEWCYSVFRKWACIRARLQSCRSRPKRQGVLTPEELQPGHDSHL